MISCTENDEYFRDSKLGILIVYRRQTRKYQLCGIFQGEKFEFVLLFNLWYVQREYPIDKIRPSPRTRMKNLKKKCGSVTNNER